MHSQKIKVAKKDPPGGDGTDFFERLWEGSWVYIKTIVDVVREPVLILDKDLVVIAANESFYRTFHTGLKSTEGTIVYELGNGQWDIPALRTLLEDILPKDTYFKGFQVAHEFPHIGRKVMMLNARRIHFTDDTVPGLFPPLVFLAMEDVTEMMLAADTFVEHIQKIDSRLTAHAKKLELQIGKLEKELHTLKKRK